MGRPDPDMMRDIIDEELYEFGEYPLIEMFPGYLAPIASDAGVDLAALVRLHARILQLDQRGRGGGAEADALAERIGRIMNELREQVKNASPSQVAEYARERDAWLVQ